jgi:hypothetical protein
MAYESFIGNCQRHNLKGHLVSVEVIIMRGMYAFVPLAFPIIISPSITLLISWLTISLVPLQRPLDGSRLWRSMTGTPIFRWRIWSRRPFTDRVFRNSIGYKANIVEWLAEESSIEFKLKYDISCDVSHWIILLFIEAATSFVGDGMAHLEK